MTPERLAELRDKVQHGYNLINSEARELMEHFGVEVECLPKRCRVCNGLGKSQLYGFAEGHMGICRACNGTGYEVRK